MSKINGTPPATNADSTKSAKSDHESSTPEPPRFAQPRENTHQAQVAPEMQQTPDFSKMLNSPSVNDRRYGWHQYLLHLLSKISKEDKSRLKHFHIFINKAKYGNKFGWMDESFTKGLCQDLGQNDKSFIGKDSFRIEAISPKTFAQEAEARASETKFVQQYPDVLFIGLKTETLEYKFATAIDKRVVIIKALLDKFRQSTGTDSHLMENLVIFIVRNEDDDDMSKYDWIGERFEADLRRELTNAFLERIGSKSLQILLRPLSEAKGFLPLIENHVYYSWKRPQDDTLQKDDNLSDERVMAMVSVIEGTGSLMKPEYPLDSEKKTVYHIGRGVTSRKTGRYRVNDIVIRESETDSDLQERNSHVSSAHADIIFQRNKYFLKAAEGGCRNTGGSPTKIIRDEKVNELRDESILFPLKDGDMIELGKKVLLLFNINEE